MNAEKEIALLKNEAQEHVKQADLIKILHFLKISFHFQVFKNTQLMLKLEKKDSNHLAQLKEAEETREKLLKQINDSRLQAEELSTRLSKELDESNARCKELEDRLNRGIEENESLYKKLREIEDGSASSLSNLNRSKLKRVDSLSDLTSLSEIDPFCLERDSLADEYNELKLRFEKAVNEIRAMKKELKESQNEYDKLELAHVTMRQDLERRKLEDRSQVELMGARIQDLTLKYTNSDRQVRLLKQKLAKAEKRRPLSLRGKESVTVQKELEDKVTELEKKIDNLEKENVTKSPIQSTSLSSSSSSKSSTSSDEHSLKRASAQLRRKSLDGNPSEAVQILLRLNSLETRVDKAYTSKSKEKSPSSSSRQYVSL